MKTNQEMFVARLLTVAVRSALVVMAAAPVMAYAADDEVKALTQPTNTIEVGVQTTSQASAKYGEYTGLNKSGATAVGNIDVRGGDAYQNEGGVTRWQLSGSDLGTTSRALDATISHQGSWSLSFSYDELQHNITDTYQTPFQGSMGGNNFTLPAAFGVINSTAIAASKPAAGVTPAVNNIGSEIQAVGTRNMTPGQLAAFQNVNVYSTRKNAAMSLGYTLNNEWNFGLDYKRLDQSGAKLIAGASSDARTGAGAAGTWAKEAMVTLMNPTNYTTDTYNLSANWKGEKAYGSASYVGSFFRNADDRVSWMSPIGTGNNATGVVTTTLAGGFQPNMLSTMPANDFHQINLNGGYNIAPTRKLVGGFSYGRNTQNTDYLVDLMQAGGLPRSSLNGKVLTTNANLKMTDQSVKDWTLSAGFKFNKRDNQTPSAAYQYIDLGGVNRISINTPYSNQKTALEFGADYKLDKRQNLRFSLDVEDMKRWCNNTAGFGLTPAGTSCVAVPQSREDKLGVNYRLKASEDLTYNLGYAFNRRRASVNHDHISPLGSSSAANATGIVNSANYPGYMAFFDASRNQNILKGSVNWQASEKLNVTAGGRYSKDNYTDSALGVQDGQTIGLNLDAAYSYTENGSFSAYYSTQRRERNMISGASGLGASNNATSYAALVAPTVTFANKLLEHDDTIGLTVRQKNLMAGKLEVVGDFSWTYGRSLYRTAINNFQVASAFAAQTCGAAILLACGDAPEFNSRLIQFKLTGNYTVDKKSKITLGYMFQRLGSTDYFYNAYQTGYTPGTLLPTNQQSPNYRVNAVIATYSYKFQ